MKKIILLIIEKIRKALKVDEKGNSFGWGKGALLLSVLMMVECCNETTNSVLVGKGLHDAHLYDIDSCEYIAWAGGVAHKGNCRFCKERRQKELKELIEQLKEK